MDCRRQNRFNLVEVVLAMGAIAVGMVSMMALFPVGTKASRDAMVANHSADMADQTLRTLAGRSRDGWEIWITGGRIPDGQANMPSGVVPPLNDASLEDVSGDGTMLRNTAETGQFVLLHYADANGNNRHDQGELLDFSAVMRVWRTPIRLTKADGSEEWIPYEVAAQLNCLVEWPAHLPPGRRQRSFYSLDVFNR